MTTEQSGSRITGSRRDHEDIFIRESSNGPEVVFDTGTQAWIQNCTEHDLLVLERAIVRRRWLHEDKAEFGAMTPREIELKQGIVARCRLCDREIRLIQGRHWQDDASMLICAAARPGGPHEPKPA